MIQIIRLIDRVLSPYALLTNIFSPCWLFATLASAALILRVSVLAIIGRGSGDKLTSRGAAGPLVGAREKPVLYLLFILDQPTYFILGSVLSESAVSRYDKIQVWFLFHPVYDWKHGIGILCAGRMEEHIYKVIQKIRFIMY